MNTLNTPRNPNQSPSLLFDVYYSRKAYKVAFPAGTRGHPLHAMDPLSICVGILAILGACSTSIKFVQSLSDTPRELDLLVTELDHLENIVKDVNGLLNVGSSSPSIVKLLDEARIKLGHVHTFIESRLHRAPLNSKSTPAKVSRKALIRQKSHLKAFTNDLREIRARLADCMAVLNL